MKNILIPTDFSANSRNAIRHALSLFGQGSCHFYLLHVVQPYIYGATELPVTGFPADVEKGMMEKSYSELERILSEIRDDYPHADARFTLMAEYGFFIDSMRKLVSEKDISLIVMGTRGASGLREMTVGSNTGDVITKVKCPVLVIPEDTPLKPAGRMVFPTDYSIPYSPRVLDTLLFFADHFSMSVEVLYMVKKNGESLTAEQQVNKEYLCSYLEQRPHGFHRVRGKNLGEAIEEFTAGKIGRAHV